MGILKYLKSNSVWFLDFFALMDVVPDALSAASITLLLHWADPLLSIYLIPFTDWEPRIDKGSLFFILYWNLAPKLFKGIVTLEKSLLDKLLSPINFIFLGDLTNRPSNNLPSVPEFLASIFILFLYLKPLIPFPKISQ